MLDTAKGLFLCKESQFSMQKHVKIGCELYRIKSKIYVKIQLIIWVNIKNIKKSIKHEKKTYGFYEKCMI